MMTSFNNTIDIAMFIPQLINSEYLYYNVVNLFVESANNDREIWGVLKQILCNKISFLKFHYPVNQKHQHLVTKINVVDTVCLTVFWIFQNVGINANIHDKELY